MEKGILKIQALWRGNLTRKYLRKSKDKMSLVLLENLLDNYIKNIKVIESINKKLSEKKIRKENFPEAISENIVKFVLFKKYKVMGSWDTKKGDLVLLNKNIEVKGFSSDGPSSFGPKEEWDWIYFIDCKNYNIKNFKVYEIKLSNKNDRWKKLMMNKKETYDDQCQQGRRPRIAFENIQKQLENDIKLIFDGNLENLI